MFKQYKYNNPEEIIESFPIAVISATFFRSEITEELKDGAKRQLKVRGFKDEDVCWAEVPGVFEIPYVARMLAETKRYEAIIVLGAIVLAQGSHYDWVAAQIGRDCQDISTEFKIPVILGILPTVTTAEAWEALGTGKCGHRGVNSVDYAIIMRDLTKQIKTDHEFMLKK